MVKKAKKAGSYNSKTNREIDLSREQLATMLCSAAVAWKTGVSFAELMANSVTKNLRPDDFWLEMADVTSSVMGMVEEISAEDKVMEEGNEAVIN